MPIECYKYERITAKQGAYNDNGINNYQEQINSLNGLIKALEEALADGKHDAENEPA